MRDRRGVTKVAFKLTKSNISQIRLWLFLRERKRGVVGAGKNEVKQKETAEVTDVMRETESSRSWGMTEETVKDKQTHVKRKGRLWERARTREKGQKWSAWRARAYFQLSAHVSFGVGWSRLLRCSAWTRRHWAAPEKPWMLLQQDFITCVKGGLTTHWPVPSISALPGDRTRLCEVFLESMNNQTNKQHGNL